MCIPYAKQSKQTKYHTFKMIRNTLYKNIYKIPKVKHGRELEATLENYSKVHCRVKLPN